jgi:predicted regulator of Ras-like GTPase activity (Roadblock/LC7/MglB family)
MALKQELSDLVQVEGVGTAVVVGRDGFVIEGVSNGGQLDTDAVGAVVSTGIGAAAAMGRELDVGDMDQAMVEYKNGVIVMSYLGRDALLAIVADLQANLGNIRYQLKKRMPAIERAL